MSPAGPPVQTGPSRAGPPRTLKQVLGWVVLLHPVLWLGFDGLLWELPGGSWLVSIMDTVPWRRLLLLVVDAILAILVIRWLERGLAHPESATPVPPKELQMSVGGFRARFQPHVALSPRVRRAGAAVPAVTLCALFFQTAIDGWPLSAQQVLLLVPTYGGVVWMGVWALAKLEHHSATQRARWVELSGAVLRLDDGAAGRVVLTPDVVVGLDDSWTTLTIGPLEVEGSPSRLAWLREQLVTVQQGSDGRHDGVVPDALEDLRDPTDSSG